MMDTLIEQKKGFKKKYISYVIAGLLLTLAAGWLFFGNRTYVGLQLIIKLFTNFYIQIIAIKFRSFHNIFFIITRIT